MEATQFLPAVVWKTMVRNVIFLTPATELLQATYRVTVKPIDVNEPGAKTAAKEIGYFLKDFGGYVYSITDINVDGNSQYIEVTDSFRCGHGPRSGRPGIVYKSVNAGASPFVAPIKHSQLDKSALDYTRAYELDILYNHAKKIEFTGTNQPSIEDYAGVQPDGLVYAEVFGQYPKIILVTIDADGNQWERQEKPIRYLDGEGLITRIAWDKTNMLDDNYSGFIIISKTLIV